MHMELDPDPLELGPSRLNSRVADCRTMLSRCERISIEVSQDLHWYKRAHRRAEAAFALRFKEMLTNDPEVRSGRSVTDREAIAHTRLRPEREEIDQYAGGIEELEAVLVVIRAKRGDLKDLQTRIAMQFKLCLEDITLGARWNARAPRPYAKLVEAGASHSMDDVDAMLEAANAALPPAPQILRVSSSVAPPVPSVPAPVAAPVSAAAPAVVEVELPPVLTDEETHAGVEAALARAAQAARSHHQVDDIRGKVQDAEAFLDGLPDGLDAAPAAGPVAALAVDDVDALLGLFGG